MSNTKLSLTVPPKHYSTSILEHELKLKAIELSWKILKHVIDMASKRCLLGEWSETNCKSYLQSYGINNLRCGKVISNCKNMKAIEIINKQKTNNTAVHLI